MPDRQTIRGYGGVFRRDWVIYSIPDGRGGRKPLPSPVPMRAVLYFVAAWLGVFVLERLPVLAFPLHALDWPLRYVAIPGIVAFVLTKAEPDGRPATRYLASWLAHRLTARCRSAGRPVRPEGEPAVYEPVVAIASDAESQALSRGQIRGPARVEFREPVLVASRRRRGRYLARPFTEGASHRERDTVATTIELDAGETLEVMP